MATKRTANTQGDSALIEAPRSLAIASEGVTTGEDFAKLMSALMGDVLAGNVTTDVAKAVCNAGDKLLKVVEMQYRYGKQAAEPRPAFKLVG